MIPEDRELVVVTNRGDSPIECRNHCGHTIELTEQVASVLAAGGAAMCIECARALAEKHPGAFAWRADSPN